MTATTQPPPPGLRPVMRATEYFTLAFGVGLPWLIVDAPPGTETLWAREVQSRAPSSDPLLDPSSAPRRATGVFMLR